MNSAAKVAFFHYTGKKNAVFYPTRLDFRCFLSLRTTYPEAYLPDLT